MTTMLGKVDIAYCNKALEILPFIPQKEIITKYQKGYLTLTVTDEEGNYFTFVPGGRYRDETGTNYIGWVQDFWVHTYEISMDLKGNPKSISGKKPWCGLKVEEAQEQLEKLHGSELLTAEEYARICEWFLTTEIATFDDIYIDSTKLGNYVNNPEGTRGRMAVTGASKKWELNDINNLSGNSYLLLAGGNVAGGCYYMEGQEEPFALVRPQSRYISTLHIGFRGKISAKKA